MTQQQDTFLIKIMRMGYWADFYIYPAVSLGLLLTALFYFRMPVLPLVGLFVLGVFLWGLAEYILHRFAFHHAPLFKQGHGEHHKHPKWQIGTPFFVTLAAYFLIAWGLAQLFGYAHTCITLSGFILGYYGYLIVHHKVHSKRAKPGSFFHRYQKFHDIHHMKEEVNFGVSWLMWDKIFRTYQKSHKV